MPTSQRIHELFKFHAFFRKLHQTDDDRVFCVRVIVPGEKEFQKKPIFLSLGSCKIVFCKPREWHSIGHRVTLIMDENELCVGADVLKKNHFFVHFAKPEFARNRSIDEWMRQSQIREGISNGCSRLESCGNSLDFPSATVKPQLAVDNLSKSHALLRPKWPHSAIVSQPQFHNYR